MAPSKESEHEQQAQKANYLRLQLQTSVSQRPYVNCPESPLIDVFPPLSEQSPP